jgi:hypothetical protein
LNFLVDNLGNIVQEVVGAGGDALQSIVGNYKASYPSRINRVLQRTNVYVDEHDRGSRKREAGRPGPHPEDFQVRRSWFARRHRHQHCRTSCLSRCAEGNWRRIQWRWKRRRSCFQQCPPFCIKHTDARYAAQQVSRNCETVDKSTTSISIM